MADKNAAVFFINDPFLVILSLPVCKTVVRTFENTSQQHGVGFSTFQLPIIYKGKQNRKPSRSA